MGINQFWNHSPPHIIDGEVGVFNCSVQGLVNLAHLQKHVIIAIVYQHRSFIEDVTIPEKLSRFHRSCHRFIEVVIVRNPLIAFVFNCFGMDCIFGNANFMCS